jgi:hypothetical protein
VRSGRLRPIAVSTEHRARRGHFVGRGKHPSGQGRKDGLLCNRYAAQRPSYCSTSSPFFVSAGSPPIPEANRSRRRTDTSVIHRHLGRTTVRTAAQTHSRRGGEIRTPGLLLPNLKNGGTGVCRSVRSVPECVDLAGVTGTRTNTERTDRHRPVLPKLIHRWYVPVGVRTGNSLSLRRPVHFSGRSNPPSAISATTRSPRYGSSSGSSFGNAA